MPTCKLCDREVPDNRFVADYGICDACALILDSKIKTMQQAIPEYQEKANSTKEPSEKILYLHSILDLLYEYKVLYADNDVNVIKQDVDDLIDQIIDCISKVRI